MMFALQIATIYIFYRCQTDPLSLAVSFETSSKMDCCNKSCLKLTLEVSLFVVVLVLFFKVCFINQVTDFAKGNIFWIFNYFLDCTWP